MKREMSKEKKTTSFRKKGRKKQNSKRVTIFKRLRHAKKRSHRFGGKRASQGGPWKTTASPRRICRKSVRIQKNWRGNRVYAHPGEEI